MQTSSTKAQDGAKLYPAEPSSGMWVTIALAAAMLMITMGIRQTVGLFVHPITHSTGMSIVDVSFALAVGQLLWGVFQPLFGAYADKKNAFTVLVLGAILMAVGQIGTVFATNTFLLTLTLGILAPAGAAAGSFSVLFGISAKRLAPERRSFASGIINAGGSLGQFAFAPIVQFVLYTWGHIAALIMLGLCGLASIPVAAKLCFNKKQGDILPAGAVNLADAPTMARDGLKEQLRIAMRDRSYILLHAGFFTCGFHVAFLTTHLPGEVALCGYAASVSAAMLSIIGLCNIVGSITSGYCGKFFRMKYILAFVYACRAALITVYMLAPKTELTFYIFAVAIGFTWLATVPPTAGIVGKLFGLRYLSTLFGLTLLSHQIGAFLGALFGGLAMQYNGNLLWVWYLDIGLAIFAAIVNLPIREEKPIAS